MKNTIILSIGIIALLFSCKKGDDKIDDHDHNHGSGKGSLSLATIFVVNGSTYHMDSTYTDDSGNNYKIALANVYLSQLRFEDHDGADRMLDNSTVLLKPEVATYDLGDIEASHFHEFKFNIGIDSATNHSDPNSYPTDSPLYPQSPSMHWTWSSGYIFYKIEGTVDTDNDGTFETTFRFHIGTDPLLRKSSYVLHSDFSSGVINIVTMKIDLGKFLKGIDLSVDNSTHTSNNMPLAVRVADNGMTAFSK
ncbi:MAG: MbnP family protein [Flavobacteriales bacterium]